MATVPVRDTITIGFSIYRVDYAFLKQLKAQGKVRHGELSKFMRMQLRQFLEAHAHNPIKVKQLSPASKAKAYYDNRNDTTDNATTTKNVTETAESVGQVGSGGGLGVYVQPIEKENQKVAGGGLPAGTVN
jgi:predicted oxidoreductase